MSRATLTAAAAALTLLATQASANYNVSAKLVCYDDGTGAKLVKLNGKNAEVIALCLGVSPTSPVIAGYALTFDSDTRELHVLRRCDGAEICDLSDQASCQSVHVDNGSIYKTDAGCIYRFLDFGAVEVEGTMICTEKENYSYSSHKYTYKTSCAGSLDAAGTPCALGFKTGKLFEESGLCN